MIVNVEGCTYPHEKCITVLGDSVPLVSKVEGNSQRSLKHSLFTISEFKENSTMFLFNVQNT